MRMIGEIEGESAARMFGDFLYAQGVPNEIEAGGVDRWVIWVKSDDDLARAGDFLKLYLANPSDERFRNAKRDADAVRRREGEDEAAYRRRVRRGRTLFPSLKGYQFGFVTYSLIFVSAIVFVLTKFGTNFDAVESLWLTNFRSFAPLWKRAFDLREVQAGEVWRLLTPIFIHMNFLHILFNSMWIATLGSQIEARQSRLLLVRLVLLLGIGSNLVQFVSSGRGSFGGMSGVVYGLIGYMWMRGKFDPGSGLRLDRNTVIMSMIWFVVCFTNWVGPIANGAHAGGLVLGMVWGWLAARFACKR